MKKIFDSIIIWGDSILKGITFNAEQSKYTLIKENAARLVTQVLGISLFNRSKMGRTITQASNAVSSDLAKGCAGEVALIEFGGNDCDFCWEEIARDPLAEHQPKTPLPVFEAHLRTIVGTVHDAGIRLLLMTLPPLHAQRYFDFITLNGLNKENILSWLGGDVQMIYRWHERYNGAILRVAAETSTHVVDVRDAFLAERRYEELLAPDGIHPNEPGHRRIADVFLAYAAAM